MSDALPALTWGEVISVIALFGNPPPVASSSGASSVVRRACRGTNDWGKRSASSLRRSITDELLPDMPHHGIGNSYVQMNSNACHPERSEGSHRRSNTAAAILPEISPADSAARQ